MLLEFLGPRDSAFIIKDLNVNLLKFLEKQQASLLKIAKLFQGDVLEVLEFFRVTFVVKVECRARQSTGQSLIGLHPNRSNHAQPWVLLSMPELEGKVPRLNVNPPSRNEDGFETNTLGPDISVGAQLCTLTDRADGLQVPLCESVFVAFDYDAVGMDLERDEGHSHVLDLFEGVILGVLKEFKHESGTATIDFFSKPNHQLALKSVDCGVVQVLYVLTECAAALSNASQFVSIW